MGFTREQLEKIISEAPEGAEYYYISDEVVNYRKIINGVVMSFNVNFGWYEQLNQSVALNYLINSHTIIDLAEKLQEMKIQESKQAEIDNTAQQVESLSKEGECDTEDALELKNGDDVWDITHVDFGGVFIGSIDSDGVIQCNDDHSLIRVRLCDLSKEKPLTPEQKQQQIDEKNGKKFYDIQHDIADVDMWDAVEIEDKYYWIEFAKKVSFKGKLESL